MNSAFDRANAWIGMPIVFAAALLLMWPAILDETRVAPPRDDALHYVAMAYNVAKYGVMTHSRDDRPEQLHPKYKREPFYPLLLAAVLRLSTNIDEYSLECLIREKECARVRNGLAFANQLLIAATIVGTAVAVKMLGGGWIAAYLACFVLLAGNYFAEHEGTYALLSEPLAALLLVGHALSGSMAFRARSSAGMAVLSGACLGLLVLTKAVFQFWLLLLLAVTAATVVAARFRTRGRPAAANLLLLLAPALVIAGGWGVRNYVHFGQFAVSERGGSVLLLRAAFMGMNEQEYRAAWCMWTPGELGPVRKQLCSGVAPADMQRFKRLNGEQKGFKDIRDEMARTIAATKAERPRDEKQMIEGLTLVRQQWQRQLMFTPLFAYRGSWIAVHGYRCHEQACAEFVQRFLDFLSVVSSYVRLLFIPAMFVLLAWAFVQRRQDVAFFLYPALYSYLIHSVATHYLPRYSVVLLPILVTALAMSLSLAWLAATRRRQV